MRALQVRQEGDGRVLRLSEVAPPEPRRGELLVSLRCAPVNPADLMTVVGTYVERRDPPFVPGVVGVGTVVSGRAGPLGAALRGRRVVFAPPPGRGGTWAEQAVTTPALCVPLHRDLSDEDGVNLLSNAATAVGLLDTVRKDGHRSVVVTAAAGELGRMLSAAARLDAAPGSRSGRRTEIVSVVRSRSQAQALRDAGAGDVLVSTEPGFEQALSEAVRAAGCRAAIDMVAGGTPETLMRALPDRSTVWVIGRLSGEPVAFDGLEQLVARGHTLRGFSINRWLGGLSLPGKLRAARKAQAVLLRGHRTAVKRRATLEDAAAGLPDLAADATAGKTVLYPRGLPHARTPSEEALA